jgi:hypothetical protein
MSPRSPLRRLLLALLAVVQVGAPVLATAAHAQFSRASAGEVAQVHAEESGHRHAPPEHPESCVLCQMLGRSLAVPVEPVAVSKGTLPEMAPASDVEGVDAREPRACIRPRAPPASA